ncbi:alpha/beta fold hydrolase [Nocardia sp. alder85J]|uniref:alpha/beta fold hydrolase n=1 Tax=Nocardia sp. alder85J TaxID=2862949 RepID=UPI001CD6D069|nr:alpha/beta hydrolase [Nocardia sp. alder85J]MCX4090792.1 alpha/beta hydrolase [Nocardia sp. alder85J]
MPKVVAPDGTSIYYERHGDGPALFFVQGSGGHHAIWYQQVVELRERYTVVTVDLRGFGNSGKPMAGFDGQDFPGDIVAVLEAEDLYDVVLIGQSVGSVAALKAALLRPERVSGVVLGHSLGGIQHPELSELVAAQRAEADKLPVVDRLMSKRFQEQEKAKLFLFQQMGTFNVATMADLRNLSADGPSLDEIAASGLDITFLAGDKDAVLWPQTVRRAHELLPGSRLTIVPDGPHSMYWERPDLYNAAVVRIREAVSQKVTAHR